MKQVIILHGGDSFSLYEAYLESLKSMELDYERLKPRQKWKPWIVEQMPETDVLLPTFPNGYNAKFEEWKIYFEKIIPFFDDDVRLVGHSLGAMFLAKYLQASPLPRKVPQLILIAAGYDDPSEDYGSFAVTSATKLVKSAETVHLFHSEDDPIVPFSELAKFQADMPTAVSHIFTGRGHFNDPTFPELLSLVKK